MMHLRRLSTLILLILPLVASAQERNEEYTVTQLGTRLADHNVYYLDSHGPLIFAAADTAGVFIYDTRKLGPQWEWSYLGLQGKACREVAVDPSDYDHLLVGVLPGEGSDAAIYQSTDGGNTWQASDQGIPSEQVLRSRSIPSKSYLKFNPADPSRVVAVGLAYPPYSSTDGGSTWSLLNEETFGFMTINDVAWDTATPGVMYAGGEGAALTALLFKSTDWGATWEQILDVDLSDIGGESAIDGIAVSPYDSDYIVLGSEGYIIRSTDAGENWEVITKERLGYYLVSPVWDRKVPERVYISGGNGSLSKPGGVLVSNDRGATWDTMAADKWATIERGITAQPFPEDFIFCSARPAEFGQDALPRGVFIIRRAASDVNDQPGRGGGLQLYPNPARGTALLQLSGRLPGSRYEVSLYDPLGRLVRTGVIDDRSSGLPSGDLPDGAYLYVIRNSDSRSAEETESGIIILD